MGKDSQHYWSKTKNKKYSVPKTIPPSSLTWLPLPVHVGPSSRRLLGTRLDATRVVSANRLVWATFSMTIPGFISDRLGFRAAFAFLARLLSACKTKNTRKRCLSEGCPRVFSYVEKITNLLIMNSRVYVSNTEYAWF